MEFSYLLPNLCDHIFDTFVDLSIIYVDLSLICVDLLRKKGHNLFESLKFTRMG